MERALNFEYNYYKNLIITTSYKTGAVPLVSSIIDPRR